MKQLANDNWLTVPEAAERLRISKNLIYTMIREGRFPFEWEKLGKNIRISVARDSKVDGKSLEAYNGRPAKN